MLKFTRPICLDNSRAMINKPSPAFIWRAGNGDGIVMAGTHIQAFRQVQSVYSKADIPIFQICKEIERNHFCIFLRKENLYNWYLHFRRQSKKSRYPPLPKAARRCVDKPLCSDNTFIPAMRQSACRLVFLSWRYETDREDRGRASGKRK